MVLRSLRCGPGEPHRPPPVSWRAPAHCGCSFLVQDVTCGHGFPALQSAISPGSPVPPVEDGVRNKIRCWVSPHLSRQQGHVCVCASEQMGTHLSAHVKLTLLQLHVCGSRLWSLFAGLPVARTESGFRNASPGPGGQCLLTKVTMSVVWCP